ncbi:MAG: exodeoxyribonuclease VII large subunit [Vampirovibrionales bacterium]|nr:exodeoxyribonuclease VII large subunit [Vampirovibrionales bacterium]
MVQNRSSRLKKVARGSGQLTLEGVDPWTVTDLTQHLIAVLSEDAVLGHLVSVRGELSNVKRSSRGHVYFTLKDESASLSGVLWASRAAQLSFSLEDGQDVVVSGQLEVYAPNGSYSLVSQSIEPAGVGALQLAFEQLKARLASEGLFDPARKQPIPDFPFRVGMITAATGAVIHDMLRVLQRKNPKVSVVLAPVPVQGEHAASAIAEALTVLNDPILALDVIILARGGGSFEDLFCFSQEPVVRAIVASRVPVITGIGHEPDFGLADAAADFSASTPTAAAEHAVGDLAEIEAFLEASLLHLATVALRSVSTAEQTLDILVERLQQATQLCVTQAAHHLELLSQQLPVGVKAVLQRQEHRLASFSSELQAFSPLATLARGYGMVINERTHMVMSSVDQVKPDDAIRVRLSDGEFKAIVHA